MQHSTSIAHTYHIFGQVRVRVKIGRREQRTHVDNTFAYNRVSKYLKYLHLRHDKSQLQMQAVKVPLHCVIIPKEQKRKHSGNA